jgi:iron complex transport system ATP-binding protein
MNMPLLSTEGLRIQAGDKLLCAGLHLQVLPGEFWCVLGKNGAGKSTLLHTLAGLRSPTQGRILLEGADIRSLRIETLAQRRGFLAQHQFDAFSSTALETVMVGRHPYQAGLGWENGDDRAIAQRALAAVGLAHCEAKDVTKLSGGERQRVALATLLAQDPDVFLMDEPTAHQDAAAQLAVMALMRKTLAERFASGAGGRAVIAACHDINLVSRFATHVLVMADGRHWLGPAERVLSTEILQLAFGCRFHEVQTEHGKLFLPV